jgi:hypothetical protein
MGSSPPSQPAKGPAAALQYGERVEDRAAADKIEHHLQVTMRRVASVSSRLEEADSTPLLPSSNSERTSFSESTTSRGHLDSDDYARRVSYQHTKKVVDPKRHAGALGLAAIEREA